jgi:ESS family glutamate:Na+ symporter
MITLDGYGTLVAASLVLLFGRRLVSAIQLLRAYSIPEPVAGGLLVAFGLYVTILFFDFEVRFDNALYSPLMLAFFASIGLNANLASLA